MNAGVGVAVGGLGVGEGAGVNVGSGVAVGWGGTTVGGFVGGIGVVGATHEVNRPIIRVAHAKNCWRFIVIPFTTAQLKVIIWIPDNLQLTDLLVGC